MTGRRLRFDCKCLALFIYCPVSVRGRRQDALPFPPISFKDNDDSSSQVDVEVPRAECDRRDDGGRAEGAHGALMIELGGSIGTLIDILNLDAQRVAREEYPRFIPLTRRWGDRSAAEYESLRDKVSGQLHDLQGENRDVATCSYTV